MPKSLLIIDDEPAVVAALLARARAAGFEVNAAGDGPSGLAAAMSQPPHVILLDIRMPGIDGFEVCRQFKANEALRHIPIIFLSANVLDENRHLAYDVGAAAFLSKPFETKNLLAALEDAINSNVATPS